MSGRNGRDVVTDVGTERINGDHDISFLFFFFGEERLVKRFLTVLLVGCVALVCALPANAQVTVKVDTGASWNGFMNVSNLPSAGGAYQFGSGWGVADLTAVFAGPTLTLGPNTIGDPNPYWYTPAGGPGAAGNKIMEANMYVEVTGPLSGVNLTFSGTVLSNSLTSAHTAIAFIKDFAPDYSSSVTTTVPLTPGPFSVNALTNPAPGRHVQYGFQMTGVNVWVTDVAPYGNVQIAAVPEPTTIGLLGICVAGVMAYRRRR